MKKLLFFISMLMLNVSLYAAPAKKLMVFGDSLSVGHNIEAKESFCTQLNVALKKKGHNIHVINYSKSGETTAGGVKKMKNALNHRPDGVIIQLGSNDAFQNVPLGETTRNLQSIIDGFDGLNIPVFLVGMMAPVDKDEAYRAGFQQMYVDLATENELLLYPFFMDGLWKEDGSHASEDYFLEDGIHPTGKGVAVMVERILPAIEQFLREDVQEKVDKK